MQKQCVKQSVNFVHARDEYQSTSTSTSCKKKSNRPQLDGLEIKSFYEELVGSASSQDSAVKKGTQKDRLTSVSKQKHTSTDCAKRKHTSSNVAIQLGQPSNSIRAVGIRGCPVISEGGKKIKQESVCKKVSTSSNTTMRRNENKFLCCAQEGDLKELRRYVEDGVDVNVNDAYGWTALMCASHNGHLAIVQYLVDSGAWLTVRDSKGRTPIDIARSAKQHNLVKYYENMGQDSDSHHEENYSESIPFYCDICQAEFMDTPLDVHNTSTVHLFNSRLPRKPTTYFLPENNNGFQMMLRAGWDKEKGLESKEQGLKYPVKTVLKRDRHGLGTEDDKKARVTHFGPNDREAVKDCSVKRIMKATTLSARAREKTQIKEKRKERTFRMAFNTD